MRLLRRVVTLVSVSILCAVGGCQSDSSTADVQHTAITTEVLEPYECGSITRLHTYQDVFLASQPAPEDFEQAKKAGMQTVINLRHSAEQGDFNERAVVKKLGLAYYNLPWNGPDELTDGIFNDSRELLRNAERPILLHCSSGNRVGAVWMAYRALDEGLPVDAAAAEARTVGMKSPSYEQKAKDYIARQQSQ